MSTGLRTFLVMAVAGLTALLLYRMLLDGSDFPWVFDHIGQIATFAAFSVFGIGMGCDRKIGFGTRAVVATLYGVGGFIIVFGALAAIIFYDGVPVHTFIPSEGSEAVMRYLSALLNVAFMASIPVGIGYGLRWITLRNSRQGKCEPGHSP
jgi:hypothetical protein